MSGAKDRAGAAEYFKTRPKAKFLKQSTYHSLSPAYRRARTCAAATHCSESCCFNVHILRGTNRCSIKLWLDTTSNRAPTDRFTYARASASMTGTQSSARRTASVNTRPKAKPLQQTAYRSPSRALCRARTCVAAHITARAVVSMPTFSEEQIGAPSNCGSNPPQIELQLTVSPAQEP
jgi:hypothetical protein